MTTETRKGIKMSEAGFMLDDKWNLTHRFTVKGKNREKERRQDEWKKESGWSA